MHPILITGGKAQEAINRANAYLDIAEAVVIFHSFPDDAASKAPPRAELVFDIDGDGFSAAEIARIYHAKKIIDLDRLG